VQHTNLITRALSQFPWEAHLLSLQNQCQEIEAFTDCILDIDFEPNELKTFSPCYPGWLNGNIKNSLEDKTSCIKHMRGIGSKMKIKYYN